MTDEEARDLFVRLIRTRASMRGPLNDEGFLLAANSADVNTRRAAAVLAVAQALHLMESVGDAPPEAFRLLHEVMQSLTVAVAGRNAPLLQRTQGVSATTKSSIDNIREGVAQACVDLFREEGMNAKQSYEAVARLFSPHGIRGCKVSSLKALDGRLSDPDKSDNSYAAYDDAKATTKRIAAQRAAAGLSTSARCVAKQMIDTLAAEMIVKIKPI